MRKLQAIFIVTVIIHCPARMQHLPAAGIEMHPKARPQTCCSCCRGFIRGLGLSANQAIHLPGAGDFAIKQIQGPSRPEPAITASAKRSRGAGGMEVDDPSPAVLATADEAERESLQRENQPDPLDAEQTWPTEEACLLPT